MSKKAKAVKMLPQAAATALAAGPEVEVVAAPAVEVVAAPAVLTKRNRVPTTVTLVKTDKAPKDRADHNKAAWDVVVGALPATAAVIVAALAEAVKAGTVPAKIMPTVYLSYMLRRGALAEAPKVEVVA